jgi:hypothetical protein
VSLTCENEKKEKKEKKIDSKKVTLCAFPLLWREKLKIVFIRKKLRIKGGIILFVKLNKRLFPTTRQKLALYYFVVFSLSDITRSGSLGMISARYLEHPFETLQM